MQNKNHLKLESSGIISYHNLQVSVVASNNQNIQVDDDNSQQRKNGLANTTCKYSFFDF